MIDAIGKYFQKVAGPAIVVLAATVMSGCYRPYPPIRPEGVPNSATWAGGLDGGGWVTCSSESTDEHNICTIYDEEGRTRGPAPYKVKTLNRAAQASELRYKYVTGKAIGLEGGLELIQVSPNQAR